MTTETVTKRGAVVTVLPAAGYLPHVKKLLTLRDTGNGYIAHAPSHSSIQQDTYLCMDYSQAHSLWLALSRLYGEAA